MGVVGEGNEAIDRLKDTQVEPCHLNVFEATEGLIVLSEDANDLFGGVVGGFHGRGNLAIEGGQKGLPRDRFLQKSVDAQRECQCLLWQDRADNDGDLADAWALAHVDGRDPLRGEGFAVSSAEPLCKKADVAGVNCDRVRALARRHQVTVEAAKVVF